MGKRSAVHGVGINDANYIIQTYSGSGSSRVRSWVCPYYCVWANMLKRCYASSGKWQPSYVNRTVSEEWHTFSAFREWMDSQAIRFADIQTDPRIADDLRNYYLPSREHK